MSTYCFYGGKYCCLCCTCFLLRDAKYKTNIEEMLDQLVLKLRSKHWLSLETITIVFCFIKYCNTSGLWLLICLLKQNFFVGVTMCYLYCRGTFLLHCFFNLCSSFAVIFAGLLVKLKVICLFLKHAYW